MLPERWALFAGVLASAILVALIVRCWPEKEPMLANRSSASVPHVDVAGGDWVGDVTTDAVRVVGVRSQDLDEARLALAESRSVVAKFDFETLGPLSSGDQAKLLEKLSTTRNSVLLEMMKVQSEMEGSAQQELTLFRRFTELMISYEGYGAAVAELRAGQHLTLPSEWHRKRIPLPADYTYVGATFATDEGRRLFVVVPYSYSKYENVKHLCDDAKAARTAEVCALIAKFNAQPDDVRRDAIQKHIEARTELLKGEGVGGARAVELAKSLIPGVFVIDRVAWTLALPGRH